VEDKDAYAEVNVFFVPPSASWNVICESAHKEEIGTVIDDAMRTIEKVQVSAGRYGICTRHCDRSVRNVGR